MLSGLRRCIKKENRKVRCWYFWRLGRALMAFLDMQLPVSSVSPVILRCTCPEVLDRRALVPLCPSSAACCHCSVFLGLGSIVAGLTPRFSCSLLCNLNNASATALLQIQLLWATLWDRLLLCKSGKQPLCGAGQQSPNREAGPEASPLWPCICFCFLVSCLHALFACPQTLHVVIMCHWYDQIQVLQHR